MNTQIESSQTDRALVTKLQNCTTGEKNAILMTLYERYKNLILKICFHYLKDYDQAQDVYNHQKFVHRPFTKIVF